MMQKMHILICIKPIRFHGHMQKFKIWAAAGPGPEQARNWPRAALGPGPVLGPAQAQALSGFMHISINPVWCVAYMHAYGFMHICMFFGAKRPSLAKNVVLN